MADKRRKGMIIKNSSPNSVTIDMETRTVEIRPGQEAHITKEEVRDPVLREVLQVRGVTIVRPATFEEDEALERRLNRG